MMRAARRSVPLFGAWLLPVGCEPRSPRARDAGTTDGGDVSVCTPGVAGVRCEGSTAVECLADGSEGARTDCSAAGQVCVADLGCRACRPGTFTCNGNDVERCADDGSGYVPHASCDAAAGQVCGSLSGVCVSACEEAARSNSSIGCEYWPVTTLHSQVAAAEFPRPSWSRILKQFRSV